MNFFKSSNWARDIIFLTMLVILVFIIIDRNGDIYIRQIKNLYDVHEVDPIFLEQAKESRAQVMKLRRSLEASHKLTEDLEKELFYIQGNVDDIATKYEKNSPALVLLGPIGTTGIVLKEQELEKKLLKMVNKIGSVAHTIQANSKVASTFEAASSIENGLKQNSQLLKNLTTRA